MGTILICLTLLWAGETDKSMPVKCAYGDAQQAAWALSWCSDNLVSCTVKAEVSKVNGKPFLSFRVDTLQSLAPVLPVKASTKNSL